VILVEANSDIGGHAMLSGGEISLGGGTSLQKKFGIKDSADEVYLEQTRPEHPTSRYAERKVVRAWADVNAEAFEFLITNGVQFVDAKPHNKIEDGSAALRLQSTKPWSDDYKETINGAAGSGLVRGLEKSARSKGVEILLEHRMTRIVREQPTSGRVLGIVTAHGKDNTVVNVRARKAVIGCTGGCSSNVFIRTIYDPRLTEEYNAGGEPWTLQSGDTEQMGMAIGASLGATSNDRTEALVHLIKANWIGCRDGYVRWSPKSPRFAQAGASGLAVVDYQDVILVNMLGRRFHNEIVSRDRSSPVSGRATFDYVADALGSAVIDGPHGKERVGGPIWSIFDADAATREKWDLQAPFVDVARGYFFSGDTLAELAAKVSKNAHQKVPMPGAALQETVTRYNSFVDTGKDEDFGKTPKYKIQMPPFYAAWSTPIIHDTLAGLRINEKCQVLDIFGNAIPGFYCAGEAAGAFALHGLGRCIGTGYIAGTHAASDGAGTTKAGTKG
jgi:succinate dehydrogenase/fumarate reductase flavoprotein subunit